MLDAARERAEWTGALGRLHLDDTDIRDYRADPETFHLAVMLDAGGIAGGMAGICQQLRTWTRGGGYLLVGEGYWKRKPPGEFVNLLGGRERDILDHRGNVQAGIEAGLVPMHAATRRATTSGTSTSGSSSAPSSATCASSPTIPRARPCWTACAAGATPTCAGAAIRWGSRPTCSTGRAGGSADHACGSDSRRACPMASATSSGAGLACRRRR